MGDEGKSHIFAEDVVRLKENGNSKKLGLVIKNGSSISDSEDSFDSDEEEEERVKSGELLVCWYPSGQEEVIDESKVELTDRSLQPGDVVRHKSLQYTNQKGYVTDVQITTDICILGTQLVIKNVDCKKNIYPLQVLSPWTRIALGPWVGYVKNVYRRVIVWLKNGSRCCLEEEQLSMLYDIAEKRDEDSPFYNPAFFPSQSVVGPARAFKEAKWLSKMKPILSDQSQVKAVVEEAKVVKIDVEWQVCGSCPPGCKKEDCEKPPAETITEDQLDQVKVFQHYQQAEIQIGDKGYYIVKEEDVPGTEYNNADCVEMKNAASNKQSKYFLEDMKKYNSNIRTDNRKHANGHKEQNSIHYKPQGTDKGAKKEKETQTSLKETLVDEFLVTVDHKATTNTVNDPVNRNLEEPNCKHDQNCKETKENKVEIPRQELAVSGSHESVVSAEGGLRQDGGHVSESDDGDMESDGPEQPKPKSSKQDMSIGSKHSSRRRRKRLRHRRKTHFTVKIKPGDRVCVEVIQTKTLADIMWQDGCLEKGVDTLNLIPTYHIDEHQFFPGYFVADKRASSLCDKYGVVKYACHNDRTCTVKWLDKTGDELSVEEDVSVYDIIEHPDFVFNPGDLVVGISGDTQIVDSEKSKGGHCVAGQVVCVNKDGHVVVAWVGGSGNQCAYKPQDLYKVESEDEEGYESETNSDASHSEIDLNQSDADEWETASEESNGNVTDDQNEDQESSSPLIVDSPCTEPDSPSCDVENVDIEALNNANNLAPKTGGDTSSRAEGFLMLSEAPASHKFNTNGTPFSPTCQRKFVSVVRKEILLLQSSLPSGILIRGFENAMELFSVLIYGPEDTPYEDGLFLFDLALPQNYPLSPPSVFFVSYSKNGLNPNLYVDGTVCISLLGTWNGKNTEVWTPKSNILQVLLSIQGLILCKEPYYNEAGYEKHRGTVEGIENSHLYNEMAILQLIASMESLAHTTHPVFDKEIKEHFKQNGQKMIKRFQSWLSQADSSDTDKCAADSSSVEHSDVCGVSSTTQTQVCKVPEFPLFPLSKGFLICLERSTESLRKVLEGIKD